MKKTIVKYCKHTIESISITTSNDSSFNSATNSNQNLIVAGKLIKKSQHIAITKFNFGSEVPIPKKSIVLRVLNRIYINSHM